MGAPGKVNRLGPGPEGSFRHSSSVYNQFYVPLKTVFEKNDALKRQNVAVLDTLGLTREKQGHMSLAMGGC